MTKEEANAMIECQGIYEIEYRKDNKNRIWHLSNIKYSMENGDNCITAFCHETQKDLHFNIQKILSAKRYWIDILEEKEVAPVSGIYLFSCRGDNHLISELYYLEKGDRLYKYFEGEYSHLNGWFAVIPLAYHFINEFDLGENNTGWAVMPNEEIDYNENRNTRIIALKPKEPLNMIPFVAKDMNGLYYYLIDTHDFGTNGILQIPRKESLGIYTAICYTEMNHIIHWRLFEKAHPEKRKQ